MRHHEPPVFLLAPPRSYSTVTVALLAGHPAIYGFPEMLLFTAPTVGELAGRTSAPWQTPGFVEAQRSGILRAIADLHEASQGERAISRAQDWLAERASWVPRRLMDYLLDLAAPQVGLEKSPETVLTNEALDACIESFPDARYIHLTRHPVTTMRSTIEHNRHWTCDTNRVLITVAASSWYLGHLRTVRRLTQLPGRQWIRVRAEDLLRNPDAHLPPLLEWLGLPADARIVAQMMHTENWRFAGTGPSGKLFGGDPKFFRMPVLRPVTEPGTIAFDPSWELPEKTRNGITALASHLGYKS